jgi:hypothetical protein
MQRIGRNTDFCLHFRVSVPQQHHQCPGPKWIRGRAGIDARHPAPRDTGTLFPREDSGTVRDHYHGEIFFAREISNEVVVFSLARVVHAKAAGYVSLVEISSPWVIAANSHHEIR